MFDYDWFFGGAFEEQQESARQGLVWRKFPDVEDIENHPKAKAYRDGLEVRTLLYLRDGFSYEIKNFVTHVRSKAHLTIECEPAEELYKVGVFLVSVPFDDVARVETFAAHRDQKPENLPMITGFRNAPRRAGEGFDGEAATAAPTTAG